jgi:hypothetical protein
MKITLTEKFSKEKAGKSIDVSDAVANDLIKEGKAIKGEAKEKAPKKGAKVVEMVAEEAQAPEAPEAESKEEIVIE